MRRAAADRTETAEGRREREDELASSRKTDSRLSKASEGFGSAPLGSCNDDGTPRRARRHEDFVRSASRLDEILPDNDQVFEVFRNRIMQRVKGNNALGAKAFAIFDINKQGRLDYEDFRYALKTCNLEFDEDQCLSLFMDCDIGKKGYITFRDFHETIVNAGGANSALEFDNGADRLRNKVDWTDLGRFPFGTDSACRAGSGEGEAHQRNGG